jgi:4,5-dihydroxyphthalate decarboxylase
MSAPPITFVCGVCERVPALKTGAIKADGIALDFPVIGNPREISDAVADRAEVDAGKMSSSEFVSRYAAGKLSFAVLPGFASRVFRRGCIAVNRKFITSATELAGKRAAAAGYTALRCASLRLCSSSSA